MAVRGCTVADLHLTDPAAAGFAFAFRVAPCRSHAGVFDSFHSQQQPVQQQHGGWQQQPQNQQHGGWQQQPQNQHHGGWQQQSQNQQHGGWQEQPQNQQHGGWQQQPQNQQHGGWQQQPQNQQHGGWQQQPQNQQHRGWQQQPQNQQHGGWQQQPQNQQQSPNQQHGGWQQQPPNQQQHGGPQQPPSSNEQQATDSQHHAASKEQNDEQTDKADGDADDQEVEPVAPPKEAESKKKLAEEKAAEAKLKERNEEESKEKEAKAKEEEREKEKIEDKAKEMLKNLPAIPEDDQANHRSWESQLSSKDVKSQMETSREMDALRNKQHAGAFYTEAALFPARRPRSGFLHFEAATAPPQHIASGSARASGLREEGNANHRSWEAQLTAEQLKQQMTQSRERDSLQGSDSSSSTDAQNPQTGASSWTSSGAGASGARRGARRGKAGSSHGASGDGGDGGADGEDQGDKADKADKGVEVEIEPEGATGTASRPVLLPVIRQLGESIGLNGHWKNDVLGINLAMKNSRTPKFFCGSPGALPVALQEDDHPSIEFRYPVKNVSVELTDLGQDGKGEKEVIWSATYSTEKPITILSGKLRPDGGDQTAYKPPCYVPKTKNRLELRVIADDPLDGTAAEVRAEAIHKKRTERSIDEVADLEVQLVDRDDPMMLERFRKEAPAAHYFGGTGGAGGAGVSGTAGTRSAAAGVAAAAAAAAADGEDEFSFAGRAPGGGFDVDSGAFGSAEEAEAYGQMLMDLAKYKKMGPYVASMAPLPVALMEDRSWRSWKSTRQALSLFL